MSRVYVRRTEVTLFYTHCAEWRSNRGNKLPYRTSMAPSSNPQTLLLDAFNPYHFYACLLQFTSTLACHEIIWLPHTDITALDLSVDERISTWWKAGRPDRAGLHSGIHISPMKKVIYAG